MIKNLLATAAIVGLAASPALDDSKKTASAGVDCSADMQSAYDTHGAILSGNTGIPLHARAVVRDLRNAAIALKQQGNEEACRDVVAVLNDLAADYKEAAKDNGTAATMELSEIEAGVVILETSDTTLDTDSLVGVNVRNYKGEFLGEVDGVMMRGGKLTHMIVGHGGFWNIGDDEAAIPISKIKWHPETEVMYINMTEEQLEKAPDYDRKDGKWVVDNNDGYYNDLKLD